MLSVVLFAVSTLLAQQNTAPQVPTQQVPDDKTTAHVEGKVVNTKTGEPLRKANITLTPMGSRTSSARQMTTEADGRFTFTLVDPGTYQVSAERNGFLTQRYSAIGRPGTGNTLTLTAGQHLTRIDFKLVPHSVVAGKILDADGDPMQRVQISVLKVTSLGGRRRATMQSSGSTNDLGEFRVYGLPAGRYYVMATSNARGGGGFGGYGGGGGFRQVQRASTEEYIPTYYPGAADTSGASLVELEAGQDVSGLLFQMRKSAIYHIRGRVAGVQPGNGQRGLRVMLMPGDKAAPQMSFGPANNANIRNDGTFEFPSVQPGSYQAVLIRSDRRPVTLGRTSVTVSSGHVDGLMLVAAEPVSITGMVKTDGSTTTPINLSAARVTLQPTDSAPMSGGDAQVKDDGTFKIDAVSRESFLLKLSGADTTYIRSVRLGTQDVTETGLDLTSAPSTATLEITLGTQPGTVEGSVKEGDTPAAGRAVTMLPDPPRPMQPYLIYTVYADQDGAYHLTGVAPGNYRIYAWEEITRELFTDPDFMKKFENDGIKVSVKEGATQHTDLGILKVDK